LLAGVSIVVTNDPHFDRVPDITVFKPGDLGLETDLSHIPP
jgi:hypothetical protein